MISWKNILNPILVDHFCSFNDTTKQQSTHPRSLQSINENEKSLQGMPRLQNISPDRTTKKNIYYELNTNLGYQMRSFHNFIKTSLIDTYCSSLFSYEHKLSVLDIGCGRGGDIMKMYFSNLSFYVGIDVDYAGLYTISGCAIDRYTKLKNKFNNVPEFYFIQMDATIPFKYDNQTRLIPNMTNDNKKLITKFFPNDTTKITQFDRINCQFTIHYYLENKLKWDCFCQNIDSTLKLGGYILITTFDADKIINLFKELNNDKYTFIMNKMKKKKYYLKLLKNLILLKIMIILVQI